MSACGKVVYADEFAAAAEALHMARLRRTKERPINIYFCRGCGGYHWGHSRPQTKKPRRQLRQRGSSQGGAH
jgi:rubrerythrin